jgi:hypothetical protein
MKKILLMIAVVCATCLMVSCKKDYQKLSTEFIRNLPDTCSLLVQVENEAEHLVYYKGQQTNAFFCYNAETQETKTIIIPNVDDNPAPAKNIGAGKENIIIGHKENAIDSVGSNVYLQFYNLQTQNFKKFTKCNWYEFNEGTKQISCISYNTDKYGNGTRTTDVYDFDGNVLTKKEAEVSIYKEVPTGTLAASHQTASSILGKSNTPNYYCQLCGAKFNSVRDLTNNSCQRRGIGEKHILYEGSEKEQYACKYCGDKYRTIKDMTFNRCHKNPVGDRHVPAL